MYCENKGHDKLEDHSSVPSMERDIHDDDECHEPLMFFNQYQFCNVALGKFSEDHLWSADYSLGTTRSGDIVLGADGTH